jgi:hypothetical protein
MFENLGVPTLGATCNGNLKKREIMYFIVRTPPSPLLVPWFRVLIVIAAKPCPWLIVISFDQQQESPLVRSRRWSTLAVSFPIRRRLSSGGRLGSRGGFSATNEILGCLERSSFTCVCLQLSSYNL